MAATKNLQIQSSPAPPPPELAMAAADVALLVVYAFVIVYFLKRFALHRKWPSLVISTLPSGWVFLALEGPAHGWISAAKWVGVVLGLLMMLAVTHADRTEKRRQ